MRRWKRHVTEPGASSRARTDADPNADSDSYSDSDPNTDAHADTNTNAERWDDHHHHVRGRVTEDADGVAGNTRHVREQRYAES